MKTKSIEISTGSHFEMKDITGIVKTAVKESGAGSGICVLYVPHTTAALAINEHADPDVVEDIVKSLDRIIPENVDYTHCEGNSQAHIKSSIIGNSRIILFENGTPLLGTWEGIFLCEFDGPRRRTLMVKIFEG